MTTFIKGWWKGAVVGAKPLVGYVALSVSVKALLIFLFKGLSAKKQVRFRKLEIAAIIGLSAFEAFLIAWPKWSVFSSEIRSTSSKKIALTFDDGPSEEHTPLILDTLKRYQCTATFFVLADCVKLYPELVQRIIREGHKVGIHSDTHTSMIFESPRELSSRIEACRKAIQNAVGSEIAMDLYRPPYGYRTINTHLAAKYSGVKVVLWSVDSKDYMYGNPKIIAAKILRETDLGDVILMHDGTANTATPEALEIILKALTQDGYTSAAM